MRVDIKFLKQTFGDFKLGVIPTKEVTELLDTLSNEGFYPLKKSVYQGTKKTLHFVINKSSKEVFVIYKKESQFIIMGSGLTLPNNDELDQLSPSQKEAQRIFLRRTVVATYTKWLQRELDYQAVLAGNQAINIPECGWF